MQQQIKSIESILRLAENDVQEVAAEQKKISSLIDELRNKLTALEEQAIEEAKVFQKDVLWQYDDFFINLYRQKENIKLEIADSKNALEKNRVLLAEKLAEQNKYEHRLQKLLDEQKKELANSEQKIADENAIQSFIKKVK